VSRQKVLPVWGGNPKNKINSFLLSLFVLANVNSTRPNTINNNELKSNQKGDHEYQIRPDSSHKPTAPVAESVGFHTIRGHPPHLSHSIKIYWFKELQVWVMNIAWRIPFGKWDFCVTSKYSFIRTGFGLQPQEISCSTFIKIYLINTPQSWLRKGFAWQLPCRGAARTI